MEAISQATKIKPRNMKKAFFLLGLTAALLFCAVVSVIAQDVYTDLPTELPDLNTLTPETLFSSLFEPVYGMVVILFGYLSAFIPGVKKLNTYGRVFAFGLIAGLGFHLFGGADIWKVGLSFLISTGLLYDGMLKPIGGLLANLLKKKAVATLR